MTATAFRRALGRPWIGGAVGIALLLLVWWLGTAGLGSTSSFPTPAAVVQSVFSDGWAFYGPNLSATISRAAQGYLWGNLAGLAVASLVLVVPRLEELVTQFGVISNCLPVTAVGPIIMVIFGGTASAIFLGALLVFFTTLVGAILGMKSAGRGAVELVAAYGGGRWTQIRKVKLIAALPAIVTALQVAVPGALLGAIVGEYLGGIDSGIGVALNAAQRQILPERVWALSIIAGLISLAGYALIGLLGRALTPWAPRKAAR
ncbi:ABC transporter permease [Mycetocola reblochoni]|uniref:Hydroxymethylpyrimidine ABC transporter, transmembrane component n=2 Tax=Mycetocola reblochoni TaxID=331618 RepID=A0A1R4KE86_9MICO|nr:ABC transporter permease subunit [Mycetocola reblochoni]RLP71095.1 ABC transporter permease subunit [Mycetocola reblochoni]SJN42588.1 Hydroxymethylpyrimidine ABC transporter, transmembrane component [Mycetocola reblochoni REB411]